MHHACRPHAPGLRRPALRSGTFLLGLLVALAVVLGPTSAAAQGVGERIAVYRVAMTLDVDGTLAVTETIDYDFGGNERRGIERFLPLVVDYDEERDRIYRYDDLTVVVEPLEGATVRSGNPDLVGQVALSEVSNNQLVRVGEVSTFITGRWRYTLSYRVPATVEAVDVPKIGPVEELAWNVIGTDWSVPIDTVDASLQLPVAPINLACYQGALRSTERCEPTTPEPTLVQLTAGPLDPGDGVTLYADVPAGSFTDPTPVLREKQTLARAFRVTPFTGGVALIGSTLAVAGIGRALSRQARDRRLALNAYLPTDAEPEREDLVGFFDKPEGPVQFRPPDGMTPGLCGVLTDERADTLDVSATIVDLAVRGYLRIEQTGRKDFRLVFLRETDPSLRSYEALLLERLRAKDTGHGVDLADLRQTFAGDLALVQTRMYEEVVAAGWFRSRPDQVRARWRGIGIGVLILGGAVMVGLALTTALALLAVPIVLSGIIVSIAARHMPSRTAEGRRTLEACVGYERFLDVADAEELRFQEQQYNYVAGLPYAMVFGLTETWAKTLAVLQEQGLQLQPTWWVPLDPGAPFRYAVFSSSMRDFNRQASSAMSVPPPSSGGGFGGGGFSGGFSGGGGGGGGGGSW